MMHASMTTFHILVVCKEGLIVWATNINNLITSVGRINRSGSDDEQGHYTHDAISLHT